MEKPTASERGGSFYDLLQVTKRYLGHRHGGTTSPNHVMEEPAFFAELGIVIHPVLSAYDSQGEGARIDWVVDDHFSRGARDRKWMSGNVVWFHRTVEDYVRAAMKAGFTLNSLRECEPVEGRFGGEVAEFARRRRVPLFLLLSATRA